MDRLHYRGRPLPLGLRLLGALLLGVLSLGLLAPLGLWLLLDYVCRHTTIDGEALELQVRPGWFFLASAKLALLSVLSLGLYAPFAWVRFVREVSSRIQHRGRALTSTADVPSLLLVSAWGFIVSVTSLGLLTPWFLLELLRFHLDRTVVGLWRFELHGSAGTFLGRFWRDALLSLLTLGLYLPWALHHQLRSVSRQTDFVPATTVPMAGVRAPALALVSIALAAVFLVAARYREHLPLEALETKLLRRTQAAIDPPPPPVGGKVAGAGASATIEALPETSSAAGEGACCSVMLPAEPELRAVTERDGTLVITNQPAP